MVTLRLVNISKKAAKRQILKNVSLEVTDKELFVIAGPPGAGKTTLLKIIAGLIAPDEGEVYIRDQIVNTVPPGDRDVGMVFEVPPIYPNRTGFGNIAFPLEIRKMSKGQIKERVEEVAELLQITHLLQRKPATYSGGELQRVALARGLVRKPRILLLDEPLKNLDAKIRETARVELKRLQREFGMTMIFSTHDEVEATAVGDRIGVINEGVIEQIGAPKEMYSSPKTVFVARFIGSPTMNLTGCGLKQMGDRWVIDASGFNFDMTTHAGEIERGALSQELLLGIRPEDIILLDSPENSRCFEGQVELTQNFGDERVVTVRVGNVSLNCLTGKDRVFTYGQKVYVKFKEEKAHIFHRETGVALARTTN
jgi:multiple sugar transport system ATP-binding protein